MITVNFDQPTTVTIVEAKQLTVSECLVEQTNDNSINKTVTCVIILENNFKTLTLWEGESYDAIGQWTDTDVINRIKELL